MAPQREPGSSELSGTGNYLSPIELQAWTALIDAGRIIDTELEQQLLDHHEISHREYEVLVRIDGAGGRSRMSTVARQIEASPPLISQTVARLEKRGWIARESATDDKRGVEAVLLPVGRRALANAAESHAALLRTLLLDHIDPPDLEPFASTLGRVADHLRGHRAGRDCAVENCPLNRALDGD